MKSMKKPERRSQANLFPSRNKTLKISCILLSVMLIALSLTSCRETEVPADADPMSAPYYLPKRSIKMPYTSEDSLNPFYATSSINVTLGGLVYTSLYKLDGSFSPAATRICALIKSIPVAISVTGCST